MNLTFPRDNRDTQRTIHKIILDGDVLGLAGCHNNEWWADFRFNGVDYEYEPQRSFTALQDGIRKMIVRLQKEARA